MGASLGCDDLFVSFISSSVKSMKSLASVVAISEHPRPCRSGQCPLLTLTINYQLLTEIICGCTTGKRCVDFGGAQGMTCRHSSFVININIIIIIIIIIIIVKLFL